MFLLSEFTVAPIVQRSAATEQLLDRKKVSSTAVKECMRAHRTHTHAYI